MSAQQAASTNIVDVPTLVHKRRAVVWLSLALLLLLLVAATLFRLPTLLNGDLVLNSDAAVVGLQAQHMLRGEWSWELWGAPYQGSIDALMLAAGFMLAGATPFTMMVVPLIGYFILIGCVFATLRRRIGAPCAAIASLTVVLTPYAVNSVTLYAPRQWCITTIALAIWLLDGAAESRAPLLRYLVGTLLCTLALYLDLFAVQFMPGLALFAAGCCFDLGATRRKVAVRLAASLLGGALGLFLIWLVRQHVAIVSLPTGSSFERLPANLQLMWSTTLPWVLGAKPFVWGDNGLLPWQPPSVIRILQIAGAASLLAGIVVGGLAVFDRRLSWPVRRLGVLGFVVAASSIGGFLVSTSPIDATSVRYLAPIIWAAPFALAPLAERVGSKRFAVLAAPYLVVAAMGGWVSNGVLVNGPLPVRHPPRVAEVQLGEALWAQGIRYATADYWQAYRLTFLWNEQPTVVPFNPDYNYDRYFPYRDGFNRAEKTALIFQGPAPDAAAAQLDASGLSYSRLEVGGFTALVVDKGACRSWPCAPGGRPDPSVVVAPDDIGVQLGADWYPYEPAANYRWMGARGVFLLYARQQREAFLTLVPASMNVASNFGSTGQLQVMVNNVSTVVPVESGRQVDIPLDLHAGTNIVELRLADGAFIPSQTFPGNGDNRPLSIAFTRMAIIDQPQ